MFLSSTNTHHDCPTVPHVTGGSVLELGCGTGASARWLARQGFFVTAVDLSAVALHAAAAAATAEGLPPDNPRWLLQDIFTLDQSQPDQELPQTPAPVHQAKQTCSQYDFIYDCQGRVGTLVSPMGSEIG